MQLTKYLLNDDHGSGMVSCLNNNPECFLWYCQTLLVLHHSVGVPDPCRCSFYLILESSHDKPNLIRYAEVEVVIKLHLSSMVNILVVQPLFTNCCCRCSYFSGLGWYTQSRLIVSIYWPIMNFFLLKYIKI